MGLHCGHPDKAKNLKIWCVATVASSTTHFYLNIAMAMVRNYTGFGELVKIVVISFWNGRLKWPHYQSLCCLYSSCSESCIITQEILASSLFRLSNRDVPPPHTARHNRPYLVDHQGHIVWNSERVQKPFPVSVGVSVRCCELHRSSQTETVLALFARTSRWW
jgi:hypothetical protein